jgi:hypothetical protein
MTQGGLLIVPNADRASLTGSRAAAHVEIERRESAVPAGRARGDRVWKAYLDVVDQELEGGHVDAAVRAWHDAYGAALASRGWEAMIAVGDSFVKIGHAARTPTGAHMNAREAYLVALIRARRDRSVDGALRSAQAFAALGERAIVEQSLYIASRLATSDEDAQQLRQARLRWTGPQTVAGS